MIFGGIDIGTSGAKITLFSAHKEIFSSSELYLTQHDVNDSIDAHNIYLAVLKLIQKAYEFNPEIKALGISSFGETFVLLDENDKVLAPSLLFVDKSGQKEGREIEKALSKEKLGHLTGQLAHNMFSLPKILAFRNNNPTLFKKVKKIFLIEDFIVYKLTKIRAIDYSLAARSLCFDINKLEFSQEILQRFSLDQSLFSTPYKSGTIVGPITTEISPKYNLIQIVLGAHDQVVNALGSGLINANLIADGNGTCECMVALSFGKLNNENIYKLGYGYIPYVIDNYYCLYALNNSSGSAFNWLIDNFFSEAKNDPLIFDKLNKNIKKTPQKIMILPHFSGCSTPYMDLNSLGAIVNLSLANSRYDIYQALLESLCFEMKISLNIFGKMGLKFDKIISTGGGSNNLAWMQIKADIFNLPVYICENKNVGTIGTAILVGNALNEFTSLVDGVNKMVSYKQCFYPDLNRHYLYMKQFKKYEKLYQKLKGVR